MINGYSYMEPVAEEVRRMTRKCEDEHRRLINNGIALFSTAFVRTCRSTSSFHVDISEYPIHVGSTAFV